MLAGKSRWLESPVVLCPEMGEGNRPTLDQFLQEFDVVFVDVTGYLNLTMGMTKALYSRVGWHDVLSYPLLHITLVVFLCLSGLQNPQQNKNCPGKILY